MPFLPGDSLIFATGALAVAGSINVLPIYLILCIAAILGDTLNYSIGHFLRDKVAARENIRFIKREYLDRTSEYFEKHGSSTIIIARFIPIIRTFAPFVAGVGKMPYRKFISYNAIGGSSGSVPLYFLATSSGIFRLLKITSVLSFLESSLFHYSLW